jgi:hypothetical protein
MTDILKKAMDVSVIPEFAPPREGDIRHSCGSSERLNKWLQCPALIDLDQGLSEFAVEYQQKHSASRHNYSTNSRLRDA